jgi:RecA-family ATPase
LVIIDALADVMSGDENDKADVRPAFHSLRKIAESTEAAILLIHHAGKAWGYRGSSAIKGAVDLMVAIQSENGSDFINFKSEKNRDGEASTWAAKAVWTADQFYLEPAARAQVEHYSQAEEYVIRHLTGYSRASVSEIKASADQCGPEAARTAIYRLVKREKIARTNPGERGEARYTII